jgi:YVTN family beta-propeller protein
MPIARIASIVTVLFLLLLTARAQSAPHKAIPIGSNPVAVAFNPATNHALVISRAAKSVVALDLASGTVAATWLVGGVPESIAINPRTNQAVVTNLDSYVSVIDATTGAIVATIPAGKSPSRVVIDPVKNEAAVTNFNSANMVVIDLESRKLIRTIPLKSGPLGIELLGETRRAVVACQYDMSLLTVNLDNGEIEHEIILGRYLSELARNPLDGQVVIGNPSNNGILAVYDPVKAAVAATIPVGGGPLSVAVYAKRNVALVSEYSAGTVSIVNLSTARVLRSIRVGDGPMGIAVKEHAGIAVVACKLADAVTILDIEALLATNETN